jgi:ParB family transcriptional regulator, chromosome partitioning protein
VIIQEIAIRQIEMSEFNVRKNLQDGQYDSTVEDLAKSIERQGLLNPITVLRKADDRYALIAGQRRLSACKRLGWPAIPAIVRDSMSDADATAVSLIENVHRADMNPRDKAVAFNALYERLGDMQAVSRETGISIGTINKYIQLLALAPELQEKLAAGEMRNTDALARLAQKFAPEEQRQVWGVISGFTQDVQQAIIKRADPGLENLEDLVDQAAEGAFNYRVVKNCPFDCSAIPDELKRRVAEEIASFNAKGVKNEVRARLRGTL